MRTGTHNGKFSVHAIAGTSVITLAFDAVESATHDLMGFAISRTKFDGKRKLLKADEWMTGYKPFEKKVPKPKPGVRYPTNEAPWQSFVWADFAVEQDRIYAYKIFPVLGKDLRLGEPLSIEVRPEPLTDPLHEIYFNRGVSASQAYAEKFGNIKPNDPSLTPEEKNKRLQWLSRGLYEAVQAFIAQAKDSSFGLYVSMYELDYPEVPRLFKAAKDRGADVRIVYEARPDEKQTEDNQHALAAAGLPLNDKKTTFAREKASGIPHNKFMVLLKNGKPLMVWTGSTNLSEGGIFGHSNVGHCVKDKQVAQAYLDYWNLLKDDPESKILSAEISKKWPNVDLKTLPRDRMTPIFSPRKGLKMLDFYADVFASAKRLAAITLPFNVDERFVEKIKEDATAVRYLILNSGRPKEAFAQSFNSDEDVIIAPGSKMTDAWGQWLKEIHPINNGSNVLYIHNKFLLVDPLGPETLLITGSANFSENSTNANDENMLIIPCSNESGKTRVQDIYLGEFFRLFDHIYSRFLQATVVQTADSKKKRQFLKETPPEWVSAYYKKGTDRFKRRNNFSFGFGPDV